MAETPIDRGCAWWVIGVVLIVLVIASFIAVRVFGVLAAMIFMEDAPLPNNSAETLHNNLGYGADFWTYTSSLNPCEIMAFYEANDSHCVVIEPLCSGDRFNNPGYALDEVASCIGTDEVSIFGVRWEVKIYTVFADRDNREQTTFDLRRDMLWTGPAPEATSTPPPS